MKRTSFLNDGCPIARAGGDRRLVVASDHPRRIAGATPIRRIPQQSRACQKHPHPAAAHAGRPRHSENGTNRRRQCLSRLRADQEGARDPSDPGRTAAMERGVRRPPPRRSPRSWSTATRLARCANLHSFPRTGGCSMSQTPRLNQGRQNATVARDFGNIIQ